MFRMSVPSVEIAESFEDIRFTCVVWGKEDEPRFTRTGYPHLTTLNPQLRFGYRSLGTYVSRVHSRLTKSLRELPDATTCPTRVRARGHTSWETRAPDLSSLYNQRIRRLDVDDVCQNAVAIPSGRLYGHPLKVYVRPTTGEAHAA